MVSVRCRRRAAGLAPRQRGRVRWSWADLGVGLSLKTGKGGGRATWWGPPAPLSFFSLHQTSTLCSTYAHPAPSSSILSSALSPALCLASLRESSLGFGTGRGGTAGQGYERTSLTTASFSFRTLPRSPSPLPFYHYGCHVQTRTCYRLKDVCKLTTPPLQAGGRDWGTFLAPTPSFQGGPRSLPRLHS